LKGALVVGSDKAARTRLSSSTKSNFAFSNRDRLIVALDLPSIVAAERVVETLGETVGAYKIGLELTYAGGLELAPALIAAGKKIFLDLKLHDIPNTVTRAAARIGEMGAALLTVHAYPQTMKAARAALAGSATRILAVTVMTSYDDGDLAEAGFALGVHALVAQRARQAQDIGIDGLILAGPEVAAIRKLTGPAMLYVTPGIRPQGTETADQKRIMTPAQALAAGADYLVVGRPVVQAPDPRRVAEAMVDEIEASLSRSPNNRA
jgi:orotidine-5'-phosphate decarboxylase